MKHLIFSLIMAMSFVIFSTTVIAEISCSDGIKNGLETDIDCGGPDCPLCLEGKQCLVSTDCRDPFLPDEVGAHCTNGICGAGIGDLCSYHGTEAYCAEGWCLPSQWVAGYPYRFSFCCDDASCNGPCKTCDGKCEFVPDGSVCEDRVNCVGEDCVIEGTCFSGECVAPPGHSCTDGIQNGLETDIDCGGPVCPLCLEGRHCQISTDCTDPSNFDVIEAHCTNGICGSRIGDVCSYHGDEAYCAEGSCLPFGWESGIPVRFSVCCDDPSCNGPCKECGGGNCGNVPDGDFCLDRMNCVGDDCVIEGTCYSGECVAPPETKCSDLIDNDFDGLIDCSDPDCLANSACVSRPFCGDGNVDEGEECDEGSKNGVKCTPACDSECEYCSKHCKIKIKHGKSCNSNGNFPPINNGDIAKVPEFSPITVGLAIAGVTLFLFTMRHN